MKERINQAERMFWHWFEPEEAGLVLMNRLSDSKPRGLNEIMNF